MKSEYKSGGSEGYCRSAKRTEDSGDYVVKMPRGTTAKTRRVLQMQTTQKPSGTVERLPESLIQLMLAIFPDSADVFSRLGNSQSLLERGQSMPKAVKVSADHGQTSNSVFSRLGLTSSSQPTGHRRVQASGSRQVGIGAAPASKTVASGQRRVATLRETSVFDRLGT